MIGRFFDKLSDWYLKPMLFFRDICFWVFKFFKLERVSLLRDNLWSRIFLFLFVLYVSPWWFYHLVRGRIEPQIFDRLCFLADDGFLNNEELFFEPLEEEIVWLNGKPESNRTNWKNEGF